MVKHILVRIVYEPPPPHKPIPGETVELTYLHTKLAKAWKKRAGKIATAIIVSKMNIVRLDERHYVEKVSEEEREW